MCGREVHHNARMLDGMLEDEPEFSGNSLCSNTCAMNYDGNDAPCSVL